MYKSILLSQLPGASNVFKDFLNHSETYSFEDFSRIISLIQNRLYPRTAVNDAILNSSKDYELFELQKNNLELLKESNTFAIVTGQQAGFLGGSLYTLLKAVDTVKVAINLKSRFPDCNFVPIFWVEDNDDDLTEASHSYLFDANYNPIEFKLTHEGNSCVSDERIKEEDLLTIEIALKELDKYPFGENISTLVREVYKVGSTWSESFVKLYQQLIGRTGILFLSASKLMKSGVFGNLVLDELKNQGRSLASVEKINAELISRNYHLQATPSEVNLFYHIGNKRFRIDSTNDGFNINREFISRNEFLKLAESNPTNFSPKVLLRPVFQDAVLPTLAYIAGPGEIAYHSQTDYLYKDFQVTKPVVLMRTSATIIDKKISRYLSKIEKSSEYFFQSYPEIEKELADRLLGQHHDDIFSDFNKKLDADLASLESYLMTLDNQLERSIKGAYVKIKEQIEQLDKKAHSSAKRTNEELMQKYKMCSNSIYPNAKPQERVISPLTFIAQNDNFVDLLMNLDNGLSVEHLFIEN